MEEKKYNFSQYKVIDGRVYAIKLKKFLEPKIGKNGYRLVTVVNDEHKHITMNYARLLLILSQPLESYENMVVDHIDRDKTNDSLENLRWVTVLENSRNRTYARRPNRDRPIIIINEDEYRIYTYRTKDLFSIPYVTVYQLANAKQGTHYSPKYNVSCYYVKLKI